jgi:Ca2+-binding RTX toxin-like protein
MFSRSRKSVRKSRSRKRRFSNHFSIESLEQREMMAADLLAAKYLSMAQGMASQPAAVAAPTAGGATTSGGTGTVAANLTHVDLDDLPIAGELEYVPPTLGASFENGVLTITGSDEADNIEVYAKDGTLYVREVVKDLIIFSMPHNDPIVTGTLENAKAFVGLPGSQLQSIVVNANGGDDWVKIDESLGVPVTMRGGWGNDTLMGGRGADQLHGGWGDDKLLGLGGNDLLHGEQGNDLLIGGDGNDGLYGHDGDDNLVGGDGNDWMEGGAGNDQMFGEAGDDWMFGGSGQNLMDGGAGNDYMFGGDDIDAMYGGDGDDLIRGLGGDDRIRGEGGNDDIEGGNGADAIDAGDGNDYVEGDAGNDVIAGGNGNDTIHGGDDQDWVNGQNGNDVLFGNNGNDFVIGEAGSDQVNGGSGSNMVYTNDPPGEQLGQITQELGWSDVTDFLGDVWDGVVGVFNWTIDKAQSIGWRFYDWAANLDDRLIRLGQDLAGALSNRPWEADFWKGLGRAVVDALEIAGLGEAWEIAFEILKPWQRGMTSEEIAVARSVFGDSIPWNRVRLDEHSLMAWIGRTHVTGFIINSTENLDDRTMIHELTHVWQYVTAGLVYIPEAIDGQASDEGYDFGGVDDLRATMNAGGGMSSYNREQQGEIVAHYFELIQAARAIEAGGGYASTDVRNDLDVYVHFVKEVSSLTPEQLDALNPPPFQPPHLDDVATVNTATTKTGSTTPPKPITGGVNVTPTKALDAAYMQYSPQPALKGGYLTIAEEELSERGASFEPVAVRDLDEAFARMG